jgi:hypothetical protein
VARDKDCPLTSLPLGLWCFDTGEPSYLSLKVQACRDIVGGHMNSSSVIIFSKQATCPSSETLLSYQRVGLTSEQRAWIASHLAACDFCGAELQLLMKYSPNGEEYALTDIPLNLRRLAEALLGGVQLRPESFAEAVYEKERLTLTDA